MWNKCFILLEKSVKTFQVHATELSLYADQGFVCSEFWSGTCASAEPNALKMKRCRTTHYYGNCFIALISDVSAVTNYC